jgi:hypothetical protein
MPVYTTWFVTVVLEVAGREKSVQGPGRSTREEAEADLKAIRDLLGTGEWINLDWITASPKHVVAAHIESTSVGSFG